MRRIIFLAVLVFFYPADAPGQQGHYGCGAGNYGLADASAALKNEWSGFHNVAGTSAVEHTTVAFTYLHRYNLRPLHTMAAAVVIPLSRSIKLSSGIFRFGDKLLNEHKISLGLANKIGFVRLGAQVHYSQLNVETVGREGILLFDFGGIVELAPKLSLAGHIFNAGAAQYNRFEESRFPVILSAGLSYRPVEEANLCVEIEKEVDIALNTKFGLEYVFYERLPVRAGFHLERSALFFGMGFMTQKLRFDYAFSHHPVLGYTHQGSCSLVLLQ